MIRFVDMRSAKIAGVRFAFWGTVVDRFITNADGEQGWDTVKEFSESCNAPAGRYMNLMPDWAHTEEGGDI